MSASNAEKRGLTSVIGILPEYGHQVTLPDGRCYLVKLRTAHASMEPLGISIRMKNQRTSTLEVFDLKPSLVGVKRHEASLSLMSALDCLSKVETFEEGFRVLQDLVQQGTCESFMLATQYTLPASL